MEVHKKLEVTIHLNALEVLEFRKLMEIVDKVKRQGWDYMADGELNEALDEVSRYLVEDLLDAVK